MQVSPVYFIVPADFIIKKPGDVYWLVPGSREVFQVLKKHCAGTDTLKKDKCRYSNVSKTL